MMTRKNCEAIAAAIKALKAERSQNMIDNVGSGSYDEGFNDGLNTLASNLCDVFYSDNPNFDYSKFLKAAGAL